MGRERLCLFLHFLNYNLHSNRYKRFYRYNTCRYRYLTYNHILHVDFRLCLDQVFDQEAVQANYSILKFFLSGQKIR